MRKMRSAIKKIKIIHLIDHPPAYSEYSNMSRPRHNWNTKGGQWVGIWGYDWADQIGIEISNNSNNIDYEVWQPDLRADKVYQARLSDKVIHKSFPATRSVYRLGFKRMTYFDSEILLYELLNYPKEDPVILICPLCFSPFTIKLQSLEMPIIFQDLGLPEKFYGNQSTTWNPIVAFHRQLVRRRKNGFLQNIQFVIISKYLKAGLRFMEGETNSKVFQTLVGVNLDIYKPLDRILAKKSLGLDPDLKVFLSSSRLTGLKQIDKLILSLEDCAGLNFKLFISGHGTREYEDYLIRLIRKLGLEKNISLIGYVSNQQLVNYYGAADIFVNPTSYDGGPMSAWKAMAMNVPVINTNVGNVYGFLEQSQAGIILDKDDYSTWSVVFRDVIEGRIKVGTPNLRKVRLELNWSTISQEYTNIFYQVLQSK